MRTWAPAPSLGSEALRGSSPRIGSTRGRGDAQDRGERRNSSFSRLRERPPTPVDGGARGGGKPGSGGPRPSQVHPRSPPLGVSSPRQAGRGASTKDSNFRAGAGPPRQLLAQARPAGRKRAGDAGRGEAARSYSSSRDSPAGPREIKKKKEFLKIGGSRRAEVGGREDEKPPPGPRDEAPAAPTHPHGEVGKKPRGEGKGGAVTLEGGRERGSRKEIARGARNTAHARESPPPPPLPPPQQPPAQVASSRAARAPRRTDSSARPAAASPSLRPHH